MTTTTLEQRCIKQVQHIIDQIMSGERDYAQGFLPRRKRQVLEIRRASDYTATLDGYLAVTDRRGGTKLTSYDMSNPAQSDLAVTEINAFMAQGGRLDLGNWKPLSPSARIYVDTSR
jgi:hypothetical protein